MTDVTSKWENFLNPDLLRGKLISASIYLAAYELLVDSIVDRTRVFFADGFNSTGWIISEGYKQEVLSRHKKPVDACLLWLKDQNAVNDADLQKFENVTICRNDVAHRLQKIVSGEIDLRFLDLLPEMISLLKKIEVWWIVNIEIPINPDFADKEIDESGIIPGPVWTLQLLIDIALGEPDKAAYYLDEFKKMKGKQ